MRSTEQSFDVVVVGGGISGLAASIFLARGGCSVNILEQSSQLGGRARTRSHEGFFLNIGPHAVYRSGAGFKILKELGVEPQGAMPAVSGGFAIKGGVKHTFPAGLVSLLTTGLFRLPAKLETARLLGSIGKIDTTPLMNLTAREWVNSEISHPAVRELILATFRLSTYTNAPDLMSAGAAIAQVQKALSKGVLYLDRGWQTLVDGLAEIARRDGVTIETGVKVESVKRGALGEVEGIQLAGGLLRPVRNVIIASSPGTAASLVDAERRTVLGQWEADAIPVKAACLDVALSRLPRPNATFALGLDSPLYYSVHSAAADLAPHGGALIHLAKYLPPDHDTGPDHDEKELDALLDLTQPGWREVLVYRRFLPDMIVMNAIATARKAGTMGRPGPAVPGIPGLFVTGDWVGREGLLVDASLASAREAAETIIGRQQATPIVAA